MIFTKKTFAFLILILFAITFLPSVVDAQLETLEEAGKKAYGEAAAGQMKAETFIGTTAGKIINAFLGLLGIILVSLIIYGGFLWMIAAGNEEKITKAKQILNRAIVGLIIIVMAYGIAYFVVNAIINATTG